MSVYIVLQLRFGDMVSMLRMYSDRTKAFRFMEDFTGETDNTWWKIAEFRTNAVAGRQYEVVLNVQWESCNTVECIGIYEKDHIPVEVLRRDDYSAETLTCE